MGWRMGSGRKPQLGFVPLRWSQLNGRSCGCGAGLWSLRQRFPHTPGTAAEDTRKIPYYEGSEALEQVAQSSCGCPFPGSVQGQVGWDFEQPGLVEGVHAHGRGVGTRWSLRSLPTQTIL